MPVTSTANKLSLSPVGSTTAGLPTTSSARLREFPDQWAGETSQRLRFGIADPSPNYGATVATAVDAAFLVFFAALALVPFVGVSGFGALAVPVMTTGGAGKRRMANLATNPR